MLQQHVAIQLTEGGGPEPLAELHRIFKAAQEGPQGASWIATRKPGAAFVQDVDSQMLAFARDPSVQGSVCVLKARIDQRSARLPDDPVAESLYGDRSHDFHAYWRIRDMDLEWMSWAELPGETNRGKPLPRAFKGSLSFAYWHPPTRDRDDPLHITEGPTLEGEDLAALEQKASVPTPTRPAMDSQGDYLSAASAATLLGVAKPTIARRVAKDEVVGFRSPNGTLCIPGEQFADGVVIEGVLDVLSMFAEEASGGKPHANHRRAWNFLCTSLYPATPHHARSTD